jgi:hypothetical protein
VTDPGELLSQAELARRANVCSWICWLLNLVIWVFGFRAARAAGLSITICWLLVVVRANGEFGLFGRYKPISEYLDRLAWVAAVFLAAVNGEWLYASAAFVVSVIWYLVSSIGSNYYARAQVGWEAPASAGMGISRLAEPDQPALWSPEPVREINCWSCKSSLPITPENRGTKVVCPKCGTKQAMPI